MSKNKDKLGGESSKNTGYNSESDNNYNDQILTPMWAKIMVWEESSVVFQCMCVYSLLTKNYMNSVEKFISVT